jgi:hypothetical protein
MEQRTGLGFRTRGSGDAEKFESRLKGSGFSKKQVSKINVQVCIIPVRGVDDGSSEARPGPSKCLKT